VKFGSSYRHGFRKFLPEQSGLLQGYFAYRQADRDNSKKFGAGKVKIFNACSGKSFAHHI
jgi:hypothetical protein